ncbi:hypothetical protein DFH08DRAFT_825024 [Mycena albidolilacea]|uniref:Uncharacterized protein n=1 Tax=Mycena albidolilacea TaxID=1033008 RepID=A0AAD7EAH5_9AGAR|nr:hypothetical protein DFH08DRAFT_825024 [Mycena albidolilacea]
MSDTSLPLSTQAPFAPPAPSQSAQPPAAFPGIQYNANGVPWLCDPNGKWVIASFLPKQAPRVRAPVQWLNLRHRVCHSIFHHLGLIPGFFPRSLTTTTWILPTHTLSPRPVLAIQHQRSGGSHRKGKDPKGNKCQHSSDSDNGSSDGEHAPKRGRRKGSSNFSKEDVTKLLDSVEKHLPLGQKGWKAMQSDFGKWASGLGRPERDLLKTKKPTGDAHCPPEIKRAHHIEGLINHRADTRELSNSEFDEGSDGSIEILDPPAAVRTAVACRATSPPLHRKSRMNAPELVDKLSQAFDPAALQSQNDEHAKQLFQTTQIFTLSQQLRDAQATIEALRTQMTIMQNHIHNVERARDHAEMRLEMRRGGYPGPSKPCRHFSSYGQDNWLTAWSCRRA